MNIDSVNRIADQLAELAGGYNAKGLLTAVLAALSGGFLFGGLLGTWFGYFFLLLPLCLGLLGAGFVAYMRFRGEAQVGQSTHSEESGQSPNLPTPQPPAPMPPQPPPNIPEGLSRLEHQIMEHISRNDGSLSLSALVIELDVPRESIQEAIEGLADRGIISLE